MKIGILIKLPVALVKIKKVPASAKLHYSFIVFIDLTKSLL